MSADLNNVRSVNYRLLELLPRDVLKQVAGRGVKTKENAIDQLIAKHTTAELQDLFVKNMSTCKQHVFLFSSKSQQPFAKLPDLSALNKEFKLVATEKTPTSHETSYLHKVTQSFISIEPLKKVELDFFLPIRIKRSSNLTAVHFVVLERGTALLGNTISWRRQKTISEEQTVQLIVGLIKNVEAVAIEPLDINRGIKYLWREGFIDTQSIQWRDGSGALTKSMDMGLYLKKDDSARYEEAMRNPLSKGAFHCMKDKDKLGAKFTCDPSNGWVSFTLHSSATSVDYVITIILQNN
jgi:hypothetical protein